MSQVLKINTCALLALLVSGCQLLDMAKLSYVNATSEHEWSSTEHSTTVPFTLVNNHIILPVQINGSEPLNFVLDSGAAATVILESHSSSQLQLTTAAEVPLEGAGSGFVSMAAIVEDTRVSVGSVSLLDQSVIRIPITAIPFFNTLDEVYFDGVIGYDFLRRFIVEINYEEMQVTFSEGTASQLPIANPASGWQALPLEIESNMPYITTEVGTTQGHPVRVKLLVDTGYTGPFSLIPASDAAVQEPGEYYVTTSQGLTGDIENRIAKASFLALGKYRLTNLVVSYSMSGEAGEGGSNGTLGNQVLNRFNVIFDYPNQRMLVRPNHRFQLPITADRSGLQIQPHRRGGIVSSVAEGSQGAGIGLQTGDIITRFNHEQVTNLNVDKLQRTLASTHEAVLLCWYADSEERCDHLELSSRY